ncbi:MAG: hypothetical protein NC421_06915 [Lachnospiraceae bacterium]|nr:hypothetical protein [Lachnospiraceae bacterium]
MKITRYTFAGLMAFVGMGAMAQDLTKEITVEKDIVPIERDASRMDRLPQLRLPAVSMKKLSWSDRAVSAPVTASISTLAPAGYLSNMDRPEHKGYVYAGYFPTLQAELSAGYRFVDNENTNAGAWLQYDGSQYKQRNIYKNKLDYRDHTAKIGADVSHRFDYAGTLSARLNYMFSSFNYPTTLEKGFTQSVNNVDFGVAWHSEPGRFEYYAALDYGYFKFGKPDFNAAKAMAENYGDFSVGGRFALGGASYVGADIDAEFVNDSEAEESGLKSTAANFGITPYFKVSGTRYSIKLGVKVGHAFNRGSSTYVAPDVKLEWMPTSKFTVYVGADGGARLNTAAMLFAENHLINPSQSYETTRKKIGVDGGFLIGPFAGASIKAWGSYATFSRQLMPELLENDLGDYTGVYMGSYDFKSINYGIMFSYEYRDIAKGYVSYEGAPRSYDEGYAAWRDRAKSVFGAGVSVSPIKALDITLDYRLRSGRAVYIAGDPLVGPFEGGYTAVKLGNVSSLDLGASYRFNDRFNVWARGENLLGSRWQENFLLPCKGVTGLVGVGYKF